MVFTFISSVKNTYAPSLKTALKTDRFYSLFLQKVYIFMIADSVIKLYNCNYIHKKGTTL